MGTFGRPSRLLFPFSPLLLLATGWLVVACDDGASDDGDPDGTGDGTGLDPDAPPVVDGDWYRPGTDTSWQWQLQGTLNTSYDVAVYDVDLFETETAAIAALQADGRRVICYFSAGSYEDFRPDSGEFEESDLGATLEGL